MKKQTRLISNGDNSQVVDKECEVNEQPAKAYRSPEVVDLGKASTLLQGGNVSGRDNFYQTYYT